MTEPDLQTIMEVKTSAGDIRDLPIITGQKQYGELHGQIVASVFCNHSLGFRHFQPPVNLV